MDTPTGTPRHVLILNWRDTRNPEGGGSEVYVERVAEELADRGHRVTLLCAAHANGAAEERTERGLTVLRRGSRHTVYLRAALTYLGGAVGLGRLSRRGLGRPDVLVDVVNGVPFLSRAYARRPVVVLVHHVHREQWPVVIGRLRARIGWWLESRLAVRVYRDCRYVTVSEATRRELGDLGVDPGRVIVVHNGTPQPPAAAVAGGAAAAKSAEPTLLVLGRLVPHKRVEIALHAVARLREAVPGLRLTVAGTGWWEEHLRAYAEELGIADRVDFAGFVSPERKQELLTEAWVALTPSLKEGWGLTIVEAAAAGTPTVAFASAGGVAEAIVDGETGLLANDEDHFVKLVGDLLTDGERRQAMGGRARAHARAFTWQESGEKFAVLIAAAVRPAAISSQRVP
ncbi:MAG: glycosyltransferase family 4 protein [Hamadaea sp.]|nr:glycosyltransferase family 4 protein [Hamadaea sp.]